MRSAPFAAVLLALAWPAAAADVAATSSVDAVTVFPQGAEVSRIAKVKLEKGLQTVVLSDIPAEAVQNSIRVEGMASGKLEIGSVDSRRLMVVSTDPSTSESERRRIENEIELLRDQKSVSEAQLQAAETQKALITNLTQLPSRPAPSQGAERTEDWAVILATIATGTAEAQRTALDAQVKIRAFERQIGDLEKRLAALAPSDVERTEVRVYVEALSPLDADLVIRYQVDTASWSPLYDARLSTGDKSNQPGLTLLRRAEIRQNSGESWDNVALSLSTTRPNASAAVPELYPVTVDFEPPPEMRPMAGAPESSAGEAVRSVKKAMAPEAVDMEVAMAEPPAPAPAPVVARQAQVIAAPFQAIFAVPGRTAVPNTGEGKRVQLLSEKVEPALSIKTAPKIDAKAYLYAKFVLPAGTPMLPGPVALFRDGTFVGSGDLPLLSPGQDHALGFGIDDLVRVKHAVVEEKRGETGLISTSRTDVRNFKLTVKNLHERAINVTVLDQVPVSANQDIKVEFTGRTPPTNQNLEDKRGVLSWEMALEPDQEQILDFGYRVVWPAAKTVTYR